MGAVTFKVEGRKATRILRGGSAAKTFTFRVRGRKVGVRATYSGDATYAGAKLRASKRL